MEGALAQHTRELAAREAALNDALAQLGERERQLGGALGQLEEVAAANDRLSQVTRGGVSPCWCAGSCAQRSRGVWMMGGWRLLASPCLSTQGVPGWTYNPFAHKYDAAACMY
jgi:hypothetical protein